VKALALTALVAAVSFSAGIVSAQNAQPTTNVGYIYDCQKLPYTSVGCDSFNDMVRSNDTQIMSALKKSTTAFVCFIPDEDEFFIANYTQPKDAAFSKTSTPDLLQAFGFFLYSRYKQGVASDSGFVFGKWTKSQDDSIPPTFTSDDTKSQPQSRASVDETEIEYNNSFKNLNGTTTTYAFQIRRSTLRFNETYTFPQPAPNTKSTPPTAPKSQDQLTGNGRCVAFQ
jgi:hypothetical protein